MRLGQLCFASATGVENETKFKTNHPTGKNKFLKGVESFELGIVEEIA